MSDRIFSVDFGSAYTKVALRTANEDTAEPVRCSDEPQEFWAPTVVAADWSKSETRLEFGFRAADIKPDPARKIAVFTNFKKDLFAPPPDDTAPAAHPLDALLASNEFEALAAKHGVLPQWVGGLRALAGAARHMFGGPNDRGVSPEQRKQDDARKLAHHYFKWLRARVLEACKNLPHTALKYEEIPLRVTVPALATSRELDQHPGCRRLREALAGTGWRLDARLFVTEPESNAVGVLTKGTNAFNKLKKKINFREMFNKGPFITVLAGDPHHPTYRALVIDVGAFTTDFAALLIDSGGQKTGASATFNVAQHSVPFGVSDLDRSIQQALPDEKRLLVEALPRKDFAALQNSVYSDGISYRVAPGKTIGGDADRAAVQGCLDEFTKRLKQETVAFCERLEPASMQELVLTGGGNNIPVVRDALIAAAAKLPGQPFVKLHAPGPGLKKGITGTLVDKLDDKFARGASALGGASIYFEPNCY
jgi:hypothetical protein